MKNRDEDYYHLQLKRTSQVFFFCLTFVGVASFLLGSNLKDNPFRNEVECVQIEKENKNV